MDRIHPLKAFRERQQPPLSQQQLAALFDVDRVTVTRWESGARKIANKKLAIIVKKTGIPAAELRPDLAALMAPSKPTEQPEPIPLPAQA